MSVHERIEERLQVLDPLYLEVVNESGNHAVPSGSESHFKVTIVSRQFNEMSRIDRHRTINGLLEEELANSIHALAIHAYTDADWKRRAGTAPRSPPCKQGKSKRSPTT